MCTRNSLHARLLVLTIVTESVPWVRAADRLRIEEIAPDLWRATARFGFMERPNVAALLRQAQKHGCTIDLSDVTYYVGHETVVPREHGRALPRWVTAIFAFLQRNSVHVSDYLRLPADSVVEIGRRVAI